MDPKGRQQIYDTFNWNDIKKPASVYPFVPNLGSSFGDVMGSMDLLMPRLAAFPLVEKVGMGPRLESTLVDMGCFYNG